MGLITLLIVVATIIAVLVGIAVVRETLEKSRLALEWKDWVQNGKNASIHKSASLGTRILSYPSEIKKSYVLWCQGLIFLKDQVDSKDIKKAVEERLLPVGRLSSRYDFRKQHFVKLDPEEIDMDYHFEVIHDDLSLDEICAKYMGDVYGSKDIDLDRPLWYVQYFTNVDGGERPLVVTTISHTVGDGVSLVDLMLNTMDKPSAEEMEKLNNVKPKPKRKFKSPFGPLNRVLIFLKGIYDGIVFVLCIPDSPSPLMRKDLKSVSLKKRFAFTEEIPLEAVKEVKNLIEDTTVNDILIALLNMILLRFFHDSEVSEQELHKMKIRAAFPINMRKRGEKILKPDGSPGNNIAYGIFKFFTSFKSRISLVQDVQQRVDTIKVSPAPQIQLLAARLLENMLPNKVLGEMIMDSSTQATGQLSNVAGPQSEVNFAGVPVDNIQFSIYSHLGVYLGLMSYNGKITCCVCTDENIADPKDLAKYWKDEFDALYQEVQEKQTLTKRNISKAAKI